MHLHFGIAKDQSLSSLDGETKLRLKSKRKHQYVCTHIYHKTFKTVHDAQPVFCRSAVTTEAVNHFPPKFYINSCIICHTYTYFMLG